MPPPRPLAQRLGAILWPSFLLAGVGTMLIFAYFDPRELAHLLDPGFNINRESGYALGFFLLWIITCASSALTWLLLRPAARINQQ